MTKNVFIYQVFEEALTSKDNRNYISYGIIGFYATYGVHKEVVRASDVCSDKEKLIHLANMCTKYQLYPIHLMDVIEDFIIL